VPQTNNYCHGYRHWMPCHNRHWYVLFSVVTTTFPPRFDAEHLVLYHSDTDGGGGGGGNVLL
jgi:hypothetical protein